jgi:GT2 family glycosyltransferase
MTPSVADTPKLSVVVVSRRGGDVLKTCLQAVQAALAHVDHPCVVVVVDNGGGPAVAEVASQVSPGIRLIQLQGNIGYAAAVGHGIDSTDSEWIATVNDDIHLDPEAFDALLSEGEKDPMIGAVGAQIRFSDRPEVVNSAGIEVDRLGVAFDRHLGRHVEKSEQVPTWVFGVSGAAALYRRKMLSDLDGFDGSFFGYLEDVDLAWRAQMRGWRALYVPQAVAYHHHSRTFGHASNDKYFLVGRNRVRLLAKNATSRQLAIYALPATLYDFAYIVFVMVTRKSLAPLLGRVAGIRDWRTYRRHGALTRRSVSLARPAGFRAALRRNASWPRHADGL